MKNEMMRKLACSGRECPYRMRCILYDNFIYYSMKCEDVEYVEPMYDKESDYCEYFRLEEA